MSPRRPVQGGPPGTSSTSIGPYEIRKVLGTGGFGAVYLGRHRESGEEAAVKTVTAPSPRLLAGLRREIHELSRLRHPGVVRILDDGVSDDGPWYAMELIVGMTLLRHVEGAVADAAPDSRASTVRLAGRAMDDAAVDSAGVTEVFASSFRVADGLVPATVAASAPAATGSRERIATVVRRLCGPLAYLHGEGIVHRDLKPENVVVREDGWPVIVDFGLSSRTPEEGRETMEAVGEVSGTVLYMAPEQARGELLDARADLYALGCILYRLLTGTTPFEGASPSELLMQHAHRAPAPPSRRCAGLDPAMEDLVLRLLAKDPRDRPGHARDVAAALESLGAPAEPLPGPEPRAYLYRARLAGRDEAIGSCGGRIDRLVREGRGGMVLVSGDAGIGRTRFLKEAGRRAHGFGLRVVAEECTPAATGQHVLRGFRRLLQDVVDELSESGGQDARELLAGHAPVLAPFATGMRLLAESAKLAVEPLPAEAAQRRLLGSLRQVLGAFLSRNPTVAMLDDLQDADELTLVALEHLLRTGFLESHPLLVLASHRPGAGREPIEACRRDPRVLELALAPLEGAHVGAIASDMLAMRPLPGAFADYLARASEGNPYFVTQYLRTAVENGLLARDPKGAWRVRTLGGSTFEALDQALPLPSTLRELALAKLAGVSPAARRLLEHASVLGRECSEELLRSLAGMEARELEEAVRELVGRHCLEARDGVLRFRHASVQEVACGSIDPLRLAGLHRVAAEALELRDDAEPASLGRHWERAGEPGRARARYRQAATAALQISALREAERLLRSCIRLDAGEDVKLRIDLLNSLRLQGRYEEALAVQREAAAIAERSGDLRDRAMVLHTLGVLHHLMGRDDESREVYESVIALCSGSEALHRTLASATGNLALLYQNRGRFDEAAACLAKALELQRTVGNRDGETAVLVNIGSLAVERGRLGDARSALEQALAIATERGDLETVALAEANLSTIRQASGELALAHQGMERAVAIFRASGARPAEGQALGGLAVLALDLGRLEEAHELAVRAVEIALEMASPRVLSAILVCQGRAAEALGLLEEARGCYERALESAPMAPVRQVQALICLTRMDLHDGRLGQARERLARMEELATRLGSVEARALHHIGMAWLSRRSGSDPSEARHHLAAAEQAFGECADRLGVLSCLCERVQLEARAGGAAEARTLAREAERVAASLGIHERSPSGRELREALEAVAAIS